MVHIGEWELGKEFSRWLLLESGVFPPLSGGGPVEKNLVQDGPPLVIFLLRS